ncbi:hypothetical protein MTO96_039483 [Rhipicephalus appendiculatus]
MVRYRMLWLVLVLGTALFFARFMLQSELVWSTIRSTSAPFLESVIVKVGTSDSKAGGQNIRGTSSPDSIMLRQSVVRNITRQLKPSNEKSSTTKKALIVKPPLVSGTTSSLDMALVSYAVVPTDKVRRVIVVTYFRAGSSFVGELLTLTPRTFYSFEPLLMFIRNARLSGNAASNASALVNHLFRCDFLRAQLFLRWAYKDNDIFTRNRFLWTLCKGQRSVCYDADVVTKVCSRAPVHVMKVTRLHMAHVRDWLLSNPDIARSVKIVHLVRDPRGILASRRVLNWCSVSKSCAHQDRLCSELRADLDAFKDLQRTFPNSTYRVRYEDMSLDSKKEALKLFAALGLNYTTSVSRFLDTHTKPRKATASNPYSTWRNSSAVTFQWRTKLSYKDIMDIQQSCTDVLLRLGYRTITNETDLSEGIPIVPTPNFSVQPIRPQH